MLKIINPSLIAMVQLLSCTYVMNSLLQKKIQIKNIKNIIILIIMTILLTIIIKNIYNFYKPMLIFGIVIVGYKYLFNISLEESISCNFINMILHAVGEFFLSITTVILLRIPKNAIELYVNKTYIGSVITFLFVLLILTILSNKLIKIKNVLIKSEKTTYLFFIVATFGISLFLSRNINNWTFNSKFLINVGTIIIFTIIIFLFIMEKYKLKNKSIYYDNLMLYINTTEKLLENYQKINHENKNQLLVIKSFMKNNNEVVSIINEILNDNNETENSWINKLIYIQNSGIKGLFYYKMSEMIKNNLVITINVSKKVKNFKFDNMSSSNYKDVCRIIGVLLDNAKEASKESNEREVSIEILVNSKNNLEIIIANSFIGNIDINSINNIGYSTKGRGRGIGLSLVKDIVNTNKTINIKTEIINNYFFQYIYIDNLNNK